MGESGTVTERRMKMPWATIVIFSALLNSIVMVTQALTFPSIVASELYTLGVAPCSVAFPMASFAFLLVLPFLRKIEFVRKRIDNEMMTYLYVASMCVSWTSNLLFGTEMAAFMSDRVLNPAISPNDIPFMMAPPTSAILAAINGGVPVPWAEWAPVILWWWGRDVSIMLLMVSLAVILRRSWIEIERLPFQQSVIAYDIAKVSIGGRSKLMQSKSFMIGVVLGIAFQLPIFLGYVFPWFPDIYGWKVNTCGTGCWYITTDSPLIGIIGLSQIQKNPLMYCLMYLAPLKVLFSTWVWYLVYLVLVQVAWIQGYYTGMETWNGCCRGYSGLEGPLWAPPFKFMALSFSGGFSALAVIYIYLNRGYLSQTLKAAIGRLSPDAVQEMEKNEALTYRQAWSLFILAFVLNLAVYAVTGTSLYVVFIMTGGLLILWIGMARMTGMIGFNSTESMDFGNTSLRLFIWPEAPQPITGEFIRASSASQCASQPYTPYGMSLVASFAAFRFAGLSGADNRNVFKTIIVAFSVGFLTFFVMMISLDYYFGSLRLSWSGWFSDTRLRTAWGDAGRWNSRPGTEPLAPYVLAGFAIVGALYYLSAHFIWFPLEPVGFIIGTSMMGAGLVGLWAPALVTWVLKTLTLRIGGSKLYEERAIPFVSGFAGGYALITVVAVVVFVMRFFIPF
jgi:hypothetical protein